MIVILLVGWVVVLPAAVVTGLYVFRRVFGSRRRSEPAAGETLARVTEFVGNDQPERGQPSETVSPVSVAATDRGG